MLRARTALLSSLKDGTLREKQVGLGRSPPPLTLISGYDQKAIIPPTRPPARRCTEGDCGDDAGERLRLRERMKKWDCECECESEFDTANFFCRGGGFVLSSSSPKESSTGF